MRIFWLTLRATLGSPDSGNTIVSPQGLETQNKSSTSLHASMNGIRTHQSNKPSPQATIADIRQLEKILRSPGFLRYTCLIALLLFTGSSTNASSSLLTVGKLKGCFISLISKQKCPTLLPSHFPPRKLG